MSARAGRARDRRAQLLALRSRTSTAQADVAWTPIGMSVSFRKPYFEKLSIFHGTKPDASDTQHVRGSGVPPLGSGHARSGRAGPGGREHEGPSGPPAGWATRRHLPPGSWEAVSGRARAVGHC